MELKDLKEFKKREKKTCRVNIRLYPSQMKFIIKHNLSPQRIMDKALNELGHKDPKPKDIDKIAKEVAKNKSKKK